MSLQNRNRFSGFRKGGKFRRRPQKNDLKKYAKKAAIGTAAGLAVAIPVTLAARFFNRPELVEVGQRAGAVVAAAGGGTVGELGFQIADAAFDRFVVVNGRGVSGTQEVYL